MTNNQLTKNIKENFNQIFSKFNNSVLNPDYKFSSHPITNFVYNHKQAIKDYYPKDVKLYKDKVNAWAWAFPDYKKITFHIQLIKKDQLNQNQINNIIAHELFHIYDFTNLPRVNESIFRLSKSKLYKDTRKLNENQRIDYIQYFYNPREFWAFAFADLVINGPLKSIAKEYLKNFIQVDLYD